jgi:hypothetical protein
MQFRKLGMSLLLLTTPAICGPSAQVFSQTSPGTAPVTKFKVQIENISRKDAFTASNGTKWTLDFSPGVWLVHDNNAPLFTAGQQDRSQGLEAIAEDGKPDTLSKSLANQRGVLSSGTFKTAVGAIKPGGIRPDQVFEFTISATPGQKLSLATMFGQSNDWFYAPNEGRIALFEDRGQPISGDVTSQIQLWNDGTEVDEEPGISPTQGPRQKTPNIGPAENGVVQVVRGQLPYLETDKVMRVTITPES